LGVVQLQLAAIFLFFLPEMIGFDRECSSRERDDERELIPSRPQDANRQKRLWVVWAWLEHINKG
jgi:hypothetical protein